MFLVTYTCPACGKVLQEPWFNEEDRHICERCSTVMDVSTSVEITDASLPVFTGYEYGKDKQ